MIAIERNGLQAWCDGYRTLASKVVFFSMFGDVNAVRGIWANLLKDRRKYTALPLDGVYATLAEGVKYVSLRRPLGHQQLHLVMLHPDATPQITPFSKAFCLVGSDPATQFWPRFNRMCPVPMRPSWRDEVWKLGLEHEKIEELDGFGLPGCAVHADASWAEIVGKAVKEGRLS